MSRELIDSNIEWIGEIPKEWKKVRGKYLYNINTGKKDANEGVEEGKYPFFTCSIDDKKIDTYSFDTEALLVAGNGIVGNTKYYNGKFDAYQRTYVLDQFCVSCNPLFLKYYFTGLLSKKLEFNKVGSVIDFIKIGDLKDFNVFLPNISSQKRIANYLDKKVSKIDETIENNKKSIELLEEYKRSKIVELSYYGIEEEYEKSNLLWKNKKPLKWEIKKLYNIFYNKKEKNKNNENVNLLSLSYGNIVPKNINSNDGLLPESFQTYQIVDEGDIILRLTDLQNDKRSLRTGLVKEKGIITSAYIDLSLIDRKKYDSSYMHYLLHSYDLCKVFYNMGSGIRQGLTYNEIKEMKFCLPNIKTQRQIVFELDKMVNKINKIINYRKQIIEKLEEYKKSLIYEAVTGKIEV